MAAHDDHLVRLLAPADLGDDVGGVGLAFEPSLHRERDGHGLAGRGHPAQPLGVLDGDRGRRDLRHALLVVEGPRVGRRDRAAGSRAHEHRHRAQLRRGGGARAAEAHRAAVALPVGGEGDDLPLDLLAPERRQLLEAPHHHDGRGDPLLRRPDAHAEAEHRQLPLHRGDDAGPLPPAHPAGHLHGLQPDALQPLGLHLLVGPGDGLLEARRAAQAVADACRQVLQPASRRPRPRVRGRGCGRRSGGSAPPGPPGRARARRGAAGGRGPEREGWSGSSWARGASVRAGHYHGNRSGPVLRSLVPTAAR